MRCFVLDSILHRIEGFAISHRFAMAKKWTSRRLRRLLKLMYQEARIYRKPRFGPTGIPGPAFDVLVIVAFLVLGMILLL